MEKEKNKKTVKKNTTTGNKKASNPKEKNKKETAKKEKKVLEEKKVEENLKEDFDEEYNEDLEDMMDDDFEIIEEEDDDEDEEIEIKEIKVEKKEVKKPQDKKTSASKIQKIEKKAKQNNKKTKQKSDKLSKLMDLFDKYHVVIYSFIAGILLTSFIAFIIWPERIATLKNGEQPVVKVGKNTYTANDLYDDMKNYYSVSLLLDEIDNDLLTKLYEENDEMIEEVNSNAEYYLNMYEQYYGYTEEQFLEKNGFSSYNAFLDYLKLDYRRNTYLDDYIEKNLSDDEIEKYYNENVFGDINTQHILVEVKSDSDEDDSNKLSDEDAKALAEEIITKLNDGTSWEQIQKDYSDKITYEDLSYQSWDASLEDSFMEALKKMDDNSYSEEPVKTSYGYHVIYRLDQKKTPKLKKVKDTIISNLISDKKEEDSNLLYKALINLRKEKNITFSDTDMEKKYNTYCDQYK